jgi:hypothetical protein
MIKQRDFWMPFAPSIMEEHAKDYLVNPKGHSAPYMLLSFETTEKAAEIAADVIKATDLPPADRQSRAESRISRDYRGVLSPHRDRRCLEHVLQSSWRPDRVVCGGRDGGAREIGSPAPRLGPYLVIKARLSKEDKA